MATVKYTLEDFVHEMESLLKEQPDQEKIFDVGSSYMERLISDPEAIPREYRVPTGRGSRPKHGSYLLYRGESGLLVTSVVWGPGDHASPHDHRTWGMIGVMSNTLSETRFPPPGRRLQSRIRPAGEGPGGDLSPGEVSLLVPDVDEIHQMDNHTDRPTVEIHVYGRDLVGLDRCRFNPETGKVTPFASKKFDNE